MPNGEYALDKQHVIVKDGVSRLRSGDLAGSTLTMDQAVRNMMKLVGAPLQTAVKMATINPAVVINVDKNKGSLEPGKDADILIIDDEVNIHLTIVKGKGVYKA
jgi:N-acetylglucosamine-6-phosphate deacetylase